MLLLYRFCQCRCCRCFICVLYSRMWKIYVAYLSTLSSSIALQLYPIIFDFIIWISLLFIFSCLMSMSLTCLKAGHTNITCSASSLTHPHNLHYGLSFPSTSRLVLLAAISEHPDLSLISIFTFIMWCVFSSILLFPFTVTFISAVVLNCCSLSFCLRIAFVVVILEL